jgi:peptide alpha-N-acetyltransferase
MASLSKSATLPVELQYVQYSHALEERYLPAIRSLISKDLSEPYSIYVYRYFLYQWGHLCFMVCGALWLAGPSRWNQGPVRRASFIVPLCVGC